MFSVDFVNDDNTITTVTKTYKSAYKKKNYQKPIVEKPDIASADTVIGHVLDGDDVRHERIFCHCGKSYLRKNTGRHLRSKMHQCTAKAEGEKVTCICGMLVIKNSFWEHIHSMNHCINMNIENNNPYFMRTDSKEYQDKVDNLHKVSDFAKVKANAKKYGYDPDKLSISTTKNHKYSYEKADGKKVHFGLILYEDFTFHQDKKRLQRFRMRNKEWADAPKYTPAHLSYYLLW
jgi:hypothetical protein